MTPAEVHERFTRVMAKVDATAESAAAQSNGGQVETKAKGCGYCRRVDGTHTSKCPKRVGCVYCRKVYPAKCKHHGGVGWDPAAKKRRARLSKRAAKGGSRQVGAYAAALAHLDMRIEAARQHLGKLVAARLAWVAVQEGGA